MATIAIVLRSDKENKKGLSPIHFRFYNGRNYFYSSSYQIQKEYWNEKTEMVSSKHPLSNEMNRFFETKLRQINRYIINCDTLGEIPSAKQVKLIISGINPTSWFTFADKHIEQSKKTNYSTGIKEKSIRNKIYRLMGDFNLHEIDYDFLTTLANRLADIPNNPTTVQKAIRYVRDIFNYAAKNGAIAPNPDLFKQIKIKATPKEKEKLSLEEINKMYENRNKFTDNEKLACDMFLFSFFTFGMRFKNIYLFKKHLIQGDRIAYAMTKNNKNIYIRIHPRLQRIIDDYIDSDSEYLFPLKQRDFKDQKEEYLAISSRNTILNKYLKFVALKLEIPKHIHIHLARHSFADALRKAGADPITAMNAMAHSSISTTQQYFDSMDQEGLDKVVDLLY